MERIFEIIEEQLHLSGVEVTEDSTFKDDLGADSIDLVELVMAFEDEFGIEVSYEELEKKVKTVGDAIEFLREQGADIQNILCVPNGLLPQGNNLFFMKWENATKIVKEKEWPGHSLRKNTLQIFVILIITDR